MGSFRNGLVPFLLAAVAAGPVAAQQETVWGAVAYVMYGERTPLVGPTAPELTPLGAQQMYEQGSMFRTRYLLDGSASSNISAAVPIEGIESNAIDNSQVAILSTDDSYVATGALAFLQGLYPPQDNQFAYGNGGRDAAVLANGTVVNYPLGGYQYPLVTTPSLEDPISSWIEGHIACTTYQESVLNDFRSNPNVQAVYNNTLNFYQTLWPTVFQSVFPEAVTNFYSAYQLFDYASYEANHNPQVANAVNASELEVLAVLAATQQLDLNANLSISGSQEGDMIRAVSGRMLATEVVNLLKNNIKNNGANNKLSLLFGSFEPFLAFFALSGLLDGPDGGIFTSLPGPGATMIFELYSDGAPASDGNTTIYPSPSELNVRFLYQPDYTSEDGPLIEYGLFTNSPTQVSMAWTDFATAMDAIGIASVADWCLMCDGASIFCPGLEEDAGYGDGSSSGSGSSSRKSSGLAPAVAGVVGALVTLAVVALAMLGAMLLGGLRFFFAGKPHHHGGGVSTTYEVERSDNVVADAGGFKGGERKAADADITVSKTGVHHERVGSWELRDGAPTGGAAVAAADNKSETDVTEILPAGRVRSTIINNPPDYDDDIMADLGTHPVDPREHI